jgi:putative protein kinase ArgK-like GTPase of G3E family
LLASARDRQGIDALLEAMAAHQEHSRQSGQLETRRQSGQVNFAVESLARRYGEYGLAQIGGAQAVGQRLAAPSERSAFALVLELGREIESALTRR